MIDSHCHLVAPEFSSDVDAVIARAREAGIERMITISDEMKDIDSSRILAEKYEYIFYTTGVHPHHASTFDLERDLLKLRTEAAHPKCKAIGEIGLDYHYMNPPSPDSSGLPPFASGLRGTGRWASSPKDSQQRVFEAQLVLAKELELPAVVHCREAVEDVWTIVNHIKPKKLVIHCCTEKWDDVRRFVDAGYFLSFTGIATYPKAEEVRETIRQCPMSQLMIETDSPFLAPVPYRGKRCEPTYVIEVAKIVADIKVLPLIEVDRETTKNAVQFFSLRS